MMHPKHEGSRRPENYWGMTPIGASNGGLRMRLSGFGRICGTLSVRFLNNREALNYLVAGKLDEPWEHVGSNDKSD
ncbi:MAG: hypothetical protein PHG06_20310 [Parabacteroides sp.]|nr:hypothetical protein [Parabacteroides sp.]